MRVFDLFMAPLLVAVPSCGYGDYVYDSEQVWVRDVRLGCSGTLTLIYDTTLESLYNSPGIRYSRDRNDLHIQVVRCWIERTCRVAAKAEYIDPIHLTRGMTQRVEIGGMQGVARLHIHGPSHTEQLHIAQADCTSGFGAPKEK